MKSMLVQLSTSDKRLFKYVCQISRFSRNSEANATELLENLEEILLQYNMHIV